ncbi:hypothetical protein D8674_037941 [Pyrus ussuriensis x Pyrus communis]|uniref:Transmembrane protein n=1 Tax=Pyrus ussuriensis x Pyrus communis TaxID=2448454 RepID=A0A5N5FSP6_9ROSA|nr:hypothetical protein D8674_037941 [Pyrus ussuriensis x Pyrus communis]
MGHHCCRREAPSSFPVLVFLAVAAVLLLLSSLISFNVETPTFEINWGLIAMPLLLLAVVHWLSSETPKKQCFMPPPCWKCGPPCKCGYF